MAISLTQCCHSLFRYSGIIKSISQMRQFNPASKISNKAITKLRHCLYPSCGFGNSAEDQNALWHVPVDRLIISYSRSSGPGGQNVNKVSTKAEVRFHVKTADWIPQDVRQKILTTNRSRVNKAGELLVTSELSRSQQRNLGDCIKKISYIIAEASKKPPEPTAEDMALRASRLEKRNNERLKQKKINSAIKQTRRVDFD